MEELASRMVAEGHEVICYNRRGHHVSDTEFDGERVDTYKGIKIKTVPTIERKGPAAFCWIPKLFRKRVKEAVEMQ